MFVQAADNSDFMYEYDIMPIDIMHKPKIYIIFWCTSVFTVEIQYKNIIWYDNFQLKL